MQQFEKQMIVIFMLAHSGVAHPKLWEEWHAKSKMPDDIVFRIFCKPSKATRKFEQDNRLQFYIDTAWASMSLVHAQLGSYAEILDTLNPTMIFMVSGTDIPIMHPDELLKLDTSKSYIPILAKLEPLGKQRLKEFGLKREGMVLCTQWIAVTKKDAEFMVKYTKRGTKLEAFQDWMDAMNTEIYTKRPLVPDEVVPWAILRQRTSAPISAKMVHDEPLTDQIRTYYDSVSPITWTSLTRYQTIYDHNESDAIDKEEVVELLNLEDALEAAIEDQFIFFRKVSADVDPRSALRWANA